METRYIVRSHINPKLILCTDGEFRAEQQVGPGGYSAKVFKTLIGARRNMTLRGRAELDIVQRVTSRCEAEIMSAILDVYVALSPENISCDGMSSRREIKAKETKLTRQLRALFTELGRQVSEGEAYAAAGH